MDTGRHALTSQLPRGRRLFRFMAQTGSATTGIVFEVARITSRFDRVLCRVMEIWPERRESNAIEARITIEHDPKRV